MDDAQTISAGREPTSLYLRPRRTSLAWDVVFDEPMDVTLRPIAGHSADASLLDAAVARQEALAVLHALPESSAEQGLVVALGLVLAFLDEPQGDPHALLRWDAAREALAMLFVLCPESERTSLHAGALHGFRSASGGEASGHRFAVSCWHAIVTDAIALAGSNAPRAAHRLELTTIRLMHLALRGGPTKG